MSESSALHRFASAQGPGSRILELGSGPGWDADFLEAQGVHVRRTDICETFLTLQRERGKAAERLDLIADELGGPYEGIVALYVFQHLDRSLIPTILHKVAGGVATGGRLSGSAVGRRRRYAAG